MYILFKNPIQLDTLAIVQYLYYHKIVFLPNEIVERNYPDFITELPTIVYDKKIYSGLKHVVELYEQISGINNLLQKAIQFKKENPKYTIKDKFDEPQSQHNTIHHDDINLYIHDYVHAHEHNTTQHTP